MSLPDVDVLVAGAGAAGLSLAVRLAERTSLSVRVIDPRSGPSADRTFCFFRGRSHPFEAAVARRFSVVEVKDPHRTVRSVLRARPYEELPGLAFAQLALERLKGSRVEVAWNVALRTFVERGDRVEAETSAGSVRAHVLVDARGGRALSHAVDARGDVHWLQHFIGHEVRAERPIFDPSVATLMDFDVSQSDGPHFVYVLPRSPHEALVEDTYFSAARLSTERYEHTLSHWLDRHGAGRVEVLRREAGVIPMTTAPQGRRGLSRVVVLGQRGGAAKASSGYAFQFIQRQCDALTEVLARDGVRSAPVARPARSTIATFFDRVMLSFLHRHPDRAPEVFLPLFASVPGDALARFLSEEGGPIDHLRVMSAVPRAPVFAEVWRARRLWLRAS